MRVAEEVGHDEEIRRIPLVSDDFELVVSAYRDLFCLFHIAECVAFFSYFLELFVVRFAAFDDVIWKDPFAERQL